MNEVTLCYFLFICWTAILQAYGKAGLAGWTLEAPVSIHLFYHRISPQF